MSLDVASDGRPVLLRFAVAGEAVAKGSKRGFALPTGRVVLVEGNRERQRAWASLVRDAAAAQMGSAPPFAGPVRVVLVFTRARAKAHHVAGDPLRPLKAGAPRYPTGKPDIDKLARCLLDALTAVAWLDDRQVVELEAVKEYAPVGGAPETRVSVRAKEEET